MKRSGGRRRRTRTATLRLEGGSYTVISGKVLLPTPERQLREGGTSLGSRMIADESGRPKLVTAHWAVASTAFETLSLGFGWWPPREAERYRRAVRDFARLALQAGVRRPKLVAALGADAMRIPRSGSDVEEGAVQAEVVREASAELKRLERVLPQGAYGLLVGLAVFQELPAVLRALDGCPPGVAQLKRFQQLRRDAELLRGTRRLTHLAEAEALERQWEAASRRPQVAYEDLRRRYTAALAALADALGIGEVREA